MVQIDNRFVQNKIERSVKAPTPSAVLKATPTFLQLRATRKYTARAFLLSFLIKFGALEPF